MKTERSAAAALLLSSLFVASALGCSGSNGTGDDPGSTTGGDVNSSGVGGDASSGGAIDGASGGNFASGGGTGAGGTTATGGGSSGGAQGVGGGNSDCTDSGADDSFSFFVTSWYHIELLSGSSNGFGGDLRYGGASTGLQGADAICQEIADRVCFGHKTWKAFLSTSTEDAIDRVGSGPWYDYAGNLVANNPTHLVSTVRPPGGCCDQGIYDELGTFHDGSTDVNNDGEDDDDHDVLTGSDEDGTYDGFSCEDWTSTTASDGGDGPRCGHAWPAQSGESWVRAHLVRGCAAGANFIQNGPGTGDTVGAGGGYGAIYCFAL